jgi:endonuclease/exonuclease/phosphatase family metal-dependent hydrolase
MRFATFNIRHGLGDDSDNSWHFRRDSTADAIAALKADVLGLQEVLEFQRQHLDGRIPGLRWFGEGRDGGSSDEQCPVVLASPGLEVVSARTLWFGTTPTTEGTRLPGASFPRIATSTRLRRDDGIRVDVINTHLDEHVKANREASVRQLVGWLNLETPTVVVGDFNAEPGDRALAALSESVLRRVPVDGGTAHGFTGVGGTMIDHIFVSRHWTIEDAGIARHRPGGRLPSDHWPVWVDARLESEAARTARL